MFCHERIIELLLAHDNKMKRGELRDTLLEEGYGKYCIYEAFRRLEWQEKILFDGNGHSKYQMVILNGKDK